MKNYADVDVQPLIHMLNQIHVQTSEVVEFLENNVTEFRCNRKDMLLRAGDICENIYFIKSGVVRGFIKSDHTEITTWISIENELVSSISSLELEIPAIENIEAIEDCEFLVMAKKDLDRLYKEMPDYNITARKILLAYYRDAEQRAYITRLSCAEQKYLFFLDHYQHISNRIPLTYIASYLGIRLETLSRLRKKLSEKNYHGSVI